ncbi:electron transfer flavoprotein subunit beta [Bacillaceae bacterium]
MKILVCIKQTFDTEEKIHLNDGVVSEENVQWIINPYDEYAIEEAVRIKEQHGGEVTVVTVGPERAESALRHALAMGADNAVLIKDINGDEYTIAKVLALYAKDKGFALVLTGNQSIDNGAAQVGVRLAEELGVPHITSVVRLELDGEKAYVERDVEGETYKIEAKLPLLVTCQQGLNEPRYPSLPNIMKAKRKSIEQFDPGHDIDAKEFSPKTKTVARYLPPKRNACVKIEDEPAKASQLLVKLLVEEAKVL